MVQKHIRAEGPEIVVSLLKPVQVDSQTINELRLNCLEVSQRSWRRAERRYHKDGGRLDARKLPTEFCASYAAVTLCTRAILASEAAPQASRWLSAMATAFMKATGLPRL